MTVFENFSQPEVASSQPIMWQGEDHPLAQPRLENVAPTDGGDAPVELPAPVTKAIEQGNPIMFSTAGENAEYGREPDFFLSPEGKLVANPNATPSEDGSINIEIQTKEAQHKSLAQAIENRTEAQKQFAQGLIRHFQKEHPGKAVPAWMENLANARPNIPDFTPQAPRQDTPVTPAPENGFENRGIDQSRGGSGVRGYANNGGFDNHGNFRGRGTPGDGYIDSGSYDGQGQPLGDGQRVQAKQIYDYLTDTHNLSPAMASGILGNIQTESAFNTGAYNAGEGAVGLIQWRGSRRVALENYAEHHGKPVTDWQLQMDFMMHELQTSESGAWAKIQQAQTPADVAAAFDKYYERSSGEHRGQRIANANNIYQEFHTA